MLSLMDQKKLRQESLDVRKNARFSSVESLVHRSAHLESGGNFGSVAQGKSTMMTPYKNNESRFKLGL